jgi:hypothetical protein
MGITQDTPFKFDWDNQKSVYENFTEWYTLNCEERSAYREVILTREEGIEVFENLFNVSVDNS